MTHGYYDCITNVIQQGFAFRHSSDRESMQSEDVDLLTESTCITPLVSRHHFFCLYLPWIAGFEALLMVGDLFS